MGIINMLIAWMENLEKEQLKRQTQNNLKQERIRAMGYYLTQELNGILSNMPRVGGMSPLTREGGLCPIKVAVHEERNTVEYIFRWSKSIETGFGYNKICDVQTKVMDYLEMYRIRVIQNMSSANRWQLKSRYRFLLNGIRVNLIQQDLYNLYLYVEVRWR